MTNQEAIRILDEQRNKFMDEWVDFGGVNEAYNMAIQALKEQETTRWKKISPAGIYECEKCGKHIISQGIECFKYCFNCGRSVK